MNYPEIILCAAVRYNEQIICGHRHSDCYNTLKNFGVPTSDYPNRDHQGFLTSTNRYVSRAEGWEIAVANKQIRHGYTATKAMFGEESILISENLY